MAAYRFRGFMTASPDRSAVPATPARISRMLATIVARSITAQVGFPLINPHASPGFRIRAADLGHVRPRMKRVAGDGLQPLLVVVVVPVDADHRDPAISERENRLGATNVAKMQDHLDPFLPEETEGVFGQAPLVVRVGQDSRLHPGAPLIRLSPQGAPGGSPRAVPEG
jgi:hypothetical protein